MPVTRVWLWLAAAAALALTSGKAHGEAAAGWGDREILFSVKSDRGSFNPAVACDSDNDCLVAFTNKGKRLKYKFRPAGGSWGDFVNALDPSTKQEQVQVAVYGKNKGWVLSFRDATINESGERLHSIKVAYITKDDASAGSAWTGSSKSVPLQVSQAFNDNSANRLPTIAADDENNVVLVWETSSEHTLGDDINIGSDKDLVSVSFTISNGSPIQESDLTEATTVFSGVETDSFQDRNPIIFKSPHDQRLVVGSTASMAGGVADIFVSETEVDVCAWNDRLRITNFDGKDADVTLAASPHKDLWLAAWEHKGVGIRYARLQHNENDKLSVESLGFIAEIAFPYMQGDEQVVLVADPMRDLHWAVFYRYRTAKESPRKYRLVFRVSKDDGQTWSDAYYADSEASSDYGRIAPVALASPLDEYMVVVHGSENVFSLNTTGTALFNIAANSASQRVPVVDYEEPGTSYSCLAVELPQNGTSLDLGDIIGSVVPSMVRCIEIAVPDATPDSAIHLNLELRFDIELMEEYLGPCPFNFIGIREDNALNSGDFSLADSGILPRRLCAAQRYEDIRVAAGSLFVFMNSGERGLSGENQGAKPLALEAWMTPGRTGLPSDTENPAFEVRAASSFEELRDHLQDDTFVHGRVTITSNYLSITRELVIRQKTNISLVADEGMDVYFHGDDILHVERGAVLWLLRGITFSRQLPGIDAVQLGDEYSDDGDIDDEIKKEEEEEEEEDDVQQRFGGLVFVEGRVGRIESCAFLDSEPTGSLGMRVGGGLLVDGTVDVIHSTTFDNMKATQGGAMAVTVHGHVSTIQDSIFVRNRQYKIQAGVGGAIAVFGTIGTIAGSTFQENHCNSGGGAIAVEDGGAIDRILDTDFVGNDADLYGGAVQFNAGSQMPSLWRGGMLLNNRALGGAAVYVTGALASPQVYGSCETGAVCFQNLGVEGNVGVSGGAFFFDENPSIDFFQIANMSFTNNSVSLGSGGAVLASGATMISVSWSNFALNQAHASGGAVALDAGAQMDFQEVTFDSNMAQGQGGALYAGAGSSTTVRKASFLNNAASYTCREYTVCNLKRVTGNRMPCEASNGMVAVLDEAGEAPMSLGCTKGVGGSIYLAAGVTAHIHQCNFAASNPLPSIDAEASYSDAIGNTKRFAAEAGKHVYAASRFRLSETSFDGGADAFAPSTAVIGCPKTCSSSGTCSRDGQVSPSVACTCAGAFEGDNGYDEGGCTQRRVKDVRASSFAFNETTSSDGDANGDGDGGAAAADGSAQVSWTWAYEDVDYFVVYRTADRSSTLASSDEWASCASVEEASTLVSDCIKIEDPFARSAALGLRFNVSSFFRVIAVVNGQESAQSDPMSSASIICDAGSEQIPTLEDGVFTCEECPRGTFVQNSEVGCLPCPNELQTTLGVATSEEDCLAPRGFYQITAIDDDGQEEVQVLPCGEGILCTAPGLTLDKLVLEPGFWRPSLTSSNVLPCPLAKACIGGSGSSGSDVSRRRELSLWTSPVYCTEGHTGPYCYVCQSGFSKDDSGLCSECTDDKLKRERGIFGAALVFVFVVWPLIIAAVSNSSLKAERKKRKRKKKQMQPSSVSPAPKNHSWSKARTSMSRAMTQSYSAMMSFRGPMTIMIAFVQVVSGIQRVFGPTYSWVEDWSWFPAAFSWTNVDPTGLPALTGCLIANDHTSRLLMATLLPILLLTVLALMHLATRCLFAWTPERRVCLASSSIYIIAMLLFLVFPSVNTTIVQTFVCDTFEDGSRALRFDYTTDCDERDWVFWYAVLMVLVYQVGPIVLFVMLIAQSDKPTLQGASFLYEFYDEQTKDSKQGCFRFRRYYEVFELVRKLLLTSVVLVVADGTLAQVAFALCVTFFAALVQTSVRPCSQGLDNVLATVVHAQLFLLLSGLLISSVVQNLFAFRVSMAVMLCLSVPLALFIVCKRLREGQRQPMQDLGQGAQSEIQDGAMMLHGQEAARRSNEGEDGGNAEGRAGFSYVIGNESRPAFYVEKQRGSIWGSFEEEDKQHDSAAPVVGATLLFDPRNSSSDCRSTVTMATTGSDQDTSVVTESVELVDARTCSLTLQ